MKFTATTILFTLGALVASCSAACNCSAQDQKCMDKCVMAANTCIEHCGAKGGNACQQSCLASNWPSMPVMQKDALADATTSNSMAESATATMMSSGMPTTEATAGVPSSMIASASSSGSIRSTLSGQNPSMTGTGVPRPSSSPKNSENPNHTSAASSSSRQILSAVGMVTVMATVATYFF